jgi:hypothetical protein
MKCKNCLQGIEQSWQFCPSCGMKTIDTDDSPPTKNPGKGNGGKHGSYGSGVRAQVFEVIVRQALAGAPWREICAGPMQVNNIQPEEVEEEIRKRRGDDSGSDKSAPKKKPDGGGGPMEQAAATSISMEVDGIRQTLEGLIKEGASVQSSQVRLSEIARNLRVLVTRIQQLERQASQAQSQASFEQSVERELNRTTKPLAPPDEKGPHHIDLHDPPSL